jgi:hypothetical protein
MWSNMLVLPIMEDACISCVAWHYIINSDCFQLGISCTHDYTHEVVSVESSSVKLDQKPHIS